MDIETQHTHNYYKYSLDVYNNISEGMFDHHGEMLSYLLEKRGMIPAELAKILGISGQRINHWLHNGGIPENPMHGRLLEVMGIAQDRRLRFVWDAAEEKKRRTGKRYRADIEKIPVPTTARQTVDVTDSEQESHSQDQWAIDFAQRIETALYGEDASELRDTRRVLARSIGEKLLKRQDRQLLLERFAVKTLEGSQRHGIVYDRLIDSLYLTGETPSAIDAIAALGDEKTDDSGLLYHASILRAAIYHDPTDNNPIFSVTTPALDAIASVAARYPAWYLQGLSLLDFVRAPDKRYDPVCPLSENALNLLVLTAMRDMSLMPLRPTVSTLIANTIAYRNTVQLLVSLDDERPLWTQRINLDYEISNSAPLYIPLLREWETDEKDGIQKARIAVSLTRLGYIDDNILDKIAKIREKFSDNNLNSYLTSDSLFFICSQKSNKSLRYARDILADNNYPYTTHLVAFLLMFDHWKKMICLILNRKRTLSLSQGEIQYLGLLANRSSIILKLFPRYLRSHITYIRLFFLHKRTKKDFFHSERFFVDNEMINPNFNRIKSYYIWDIRIYSIHYFMWYYKISIIYRRLKNLMRGTFRRFNP